MYKEKFAWLGEDEACKKAVACLVAHAGFTESKERLLDFISRVTDGDPTPIFNRLVEKGVITDLCPDRTDLFWKYQVNVVTDKGSPYKERY